ncbi:HET-domain-containing protein, partial [Zopfia rhizophila CBS 207.26]
KWTALSYCWGTTATLKTTLDTLEEHKKKILLGNLPQTIRDAIMITRSLGIEYLWVDALCIIQDCKNDWAQESAMMADVYRNSVVTIAASSGKDSQGSCFLNRNKLANLPCPINFHPLQQRGWTLQEAQLNIRVLHYTESELLWQHLITADDPVVPRRMFDAFSIVPRNVFSRWYMLVEEFTARRLTFETDKLPAISGMAAEEDGFPPIVEWPDASTDSIYLAGLWQADLIEGLAWHVVAHQEPGKNAGQYRAPSWSWAFVSGQVSY